LEHRQDRGRERRGESLQYLFHLYRIEEIGKGGGKEKKEELDEIFSIQHTRSPAIGKKRGEREIVSTIFSSTYRGKRRREPTFIFLNPV